MMMLSEAAIATRGTVVGGDVNFSSVTTDSRKLLSGSLFVALRGENFDGHDFITQCFEQGAVAAMVQTGSMISQLSPKPLLQVDDTRLGLGDLAANWRGKFDIPLAAITGSNGKTTVKEMLAAILRSASTEASVLATEGNLNNDIGMPLTLLKLYAAHRFAVLEMGMNHPGEISYLSRIAQPTVALVNNASAAHLQGLGSVESVARAKGEIFEGLSDKGIAVINADDPHAGLWQQLAEKRTQLLFGLQPTADISADFALQSTASELDLKTPAGSIHFKLAVPGLHNVKNALAASAAAFAMNISLQNIASGLESFQGVKGRLQHKRGCCGCTVIDDTYNANPASMRAAISVLANMPGQKVFVMGDMGELGTDAAALHIEIGMEAKKAGISRLYTLGEMSLGAASAFGAGAVHSDSAEALSKTLKDTLNGDTTVLVKGSRFMRMERVVETLTQKEVASCC